jgi:hypothetical protein
MKFLEILGLIFLILIGLMLVPLALGITIKILEVVFGLIIAGIVLLTVLGTLLLPLALMAIFFKWAYRKLKE